MEKSVKWSAHTQFYPHSEAVKQQSMPKQGEQPNKAAFKEWNLSAKARKTLSKRHKAEHPDWIKNKISEVALPESAPKEYGWLEGKGVVSDQ